jgi:hypothetical protein
MSHSDNKDYAEYEAMQTLAELVKQSPNRLDPIGKDIVDLCLRKPSQQALGVIKAVVSAQPALLLPRLNSIVQNGLKNKSHSNTIVVENCKLPLYITHTLVRIMLDLGNLYPVEVAKSIDQQGKLDQLVSTSHLYILLTTPVYQLHYLPEEALVK